MPKLVFSFAGTGDPGDGYAENIENSNSFENGVIRIPLRGCQHANVGGGVIFPDLDIAASKIREAFNGNGTLDLQRLKDNLGYGENGAICRIEGLPNELDENNIEIDNIALQGFSRGAVTTFAVAKKLDDLAKPIDIIANQPVPGQLSENTPVSLFSRYQDLSQCQNIRSATVLVATHNLENGFLHNKFFQQMVPRFNPGINANIWLLPHQSHLEHFRHNIVSNHVSRLLNNQGYTSELSVNNESSLVNLYRKGDLYFTPPELRQKIFGDVSSITMDPVYSSMIKEDAIRILNETAIDPLTYQNLSYEQSAAIIAISKTKFDKNAEKKLMEFAIQNNENAKKFVHIVNRVQDTTDYLTHSTIEKKTIGLLPVSDPYDPEAFSHIRAECELYVMDNSKKIYHVDKHRQVSPVTGLSGENIAKLQTMLTQAGNGKWASTSDLKIIDETTGRNITGEKSKKIQTSSFEYKKAIFASAHEYLTTENPTADKQKDFIGDVKAAQHKFENEALDIDRGVMRKAMKIISNTILHVTGLFLLANTLNKALTGNWFVFDKTRSTNVMRDVVKDVVHTADYKTELHKIIDPPSDEKDSNQSPSSSNATKQSR